MTTNNDEWVGQGSLHINGCEFPGPDGRWKCAPTCVTGLLQEVKQLRELLVSCEGYAIASGAERPFVEIYAKDSELRQVLARAGTYPPGARAHHPGPLSLNLPEEEPKVKRHHFSIPHNRGVEVGDVADCGFIATQEWITLKSDSVCARCWG